MKTDVIRVSSRKDQINEVLKQVDKTTSYKELSAKDALHLRLLAEEMMGLMRAIAGDTEGEFWLEDRDGMFELHLLVDTKMNFTQREQLLSSSTSGKNEANRGLIGKLRSFFEPIEGLPMFFNVPQEMNEGISWSMSVYQAELSRAVAQHRQGADEAWDELEKSVIAHVADEVKVFIHGTYSELVVYKKTS